jgi:RND superfamily putative drug exporter
MPDKKTRSAEDERRASAHRVARIVVWLRYLVLPAWIFAALLASTQLPSIFNAETSELGSLLPRSSQAIEVERRAIETFGLPLLSRTIVIAHEPSGFGPEQEAAATRYIGSIDKRGEGASVRAVPLLDAPGVLGARSYGSTLVVFLYMDPALSESESGEAASGFASGLKRATGAAEAEVTGALPATRAETDIANRDILWVELATILLVVGILAFYFRSIGVPLLGLASVAIAYQLADHVLGWMGERFGLEIPREVEPVVIALLFGTLTDYVVFFASDYRRRVSAGESSVPAATGATAELLPVVLTAALMIAGATLTLMLSGVSFLSAFGPGMAVAVVIGAAIAVTFVPCALAIFGRRLLWPWKPERETEGKRAQDEPPRGGRGTGRARSSPGRHEGSSDRACRPPAGHRHHFVPRPARRRGHRPPRHGPRQPVDPRPARLELSQARLRPGC